MSIADEARAALIRVNIEQSEVGMTVWDSDGRFIIIQPEQIVRNPEAAPSDTDRERLAKVIMDALDSLWVSDDRVLGKLHARDEILAAGFSRTSQPVQVEVTDWEYAVAWDDVQEPVRWHDREVCERSIRDHSAPGRVGVLMRRPKVVWEPAPAALGGGE